MSVSTLSKSSLKKRSKIMANPEIMYTKFDEFFKSLEHYREAEGIRKGVRDNNPDALIAFEKYYNGLREKLNCAISGSWLECLHLAQSIVNDLHLFGEEYSPEYLIVHIIMNKRKAKDNLKKLKENRDLPLLSSLDLV